MNTTAIKYFVAVAENGNISKVARELYVSQPAVSKMIHQLEKELDCSLFEHRRGQIELNENGQKFYAHARKIIDELEESRMELLSAEGVARTEIRVGSSIYDFFCELTPDYLSQHPKVSIHQFFAKTSELRDKIMDNSLHFAISMEPLSDSLPWEILVESPFIMLLPENHPAMRKSVARLSDFQSDSFVVCSMGVDERKVTELCASAGFKPKIVLNTNEAFTAGNVLTKVRAVSICTADSFCSRHPMYGVVSYDSLSHESMLQPRKAVLLGDVQEKHFLGLTCRRKPLNKECDMFYKRVRDFLEQKQKNLNSFVKYYFDAT